MGLGCSRRGQSENILEASPESYEDWILIPSSEDHRNSIGEQPPGATLPLSRAKALWIRAILKIWFLRRLRVLWSRAGSWLNLCRPGSVEPGVRSRIASWWAGSGRALLARHNTKELLEPLARGSRAARARQLERFRTILARIRAEAELQ